MVHIDNLQKTVFNRTYAQINPKTGLRETWEEAVDRYITFFEPKVKHIPLMHTMLTKEARESLVNMGAMPSMRALWSAGKSLEVENAQAYNCAYLPVHDIKAFGEAMYLLMCGTGVGFSVEHPEKLPCVPEKLSQADGTIVVGDSRQGWAEAYVAYLGNLYEGLVYNVDFSFIRPKGSPLVTSGGIASGAEPLIELFEETLEIFENAKGRKLTSLELHDMMMGVAHCVVAGGKRRSATISFSTLEDVNMRDAKKGEWWANHPKRSHANNSVVLPRNVSYEDFEKEWEALRTSGSGERGLVFEESLESDVTSIGRAFEDNRMNPCFLGSTLIKTATGDVPIEDLAKLESFQIVRVDGTIGESKAWSTGVKETIALKDCRGNTIITVTPDHRLMTSEGKTIEAKDAKGYRIMPYLKAPKHNKQTVGLGFIQGDGTTTKLYTENHLCVNINQEKDKEFFDIFGWNGKRQVTLDSGWKNACKFLGMSGKQLPERDLPELFSVQSLEFKRAFLNGLYSANGSVIKGHRVALKTSCEELAHQVVEALEELGFHPYITTNKSKEVKFSNGVYTCKQSYDINLSRAEDLIKFYNEINFTQGYKREALRETILKHKAPLVQTIQSTGYHEVYDFTEPKYHWGVANGIIAHNCGEVILKPYQMCNLSEIIVRPEDTLETLRTKAVHATLFGTLQATLTDFSYLRDDWRKNMEEERLLGVSMTGMRDHKVLGSKSKEAARWLRTIKQDIIKYNEVFSYALGINKAASVTSVKPSGTVSLLGDCASGIHPRYAPYYIRRIEISKIDPVAQELIDAGVPYEQNVYNKDSWSFTFYKKAPEGAKCQQELTALEQLEYWSMVKKNYTTHNPSITIYVGEDEWDALKEKVWELKPSGIALLPKDLGTYTQTPLEEISEEEYLRNTKTTKDITFHTIAPILEANGESGCAGGACAF